MKTINILKTLALLATAFVIAACEEELGTPDGGEDLPEQVAPNFPALIEDYAVEPGSTQSVSFVPNYDWKVSIPSEIRQWFWIKDGSFTVAELTGKASKDTVTVYVGVTENAEFDKNYECNVTLEMGDSSKVVAKYMLPAKEKVLQVYAANTISENEFELAEDGVSYVYSSEVATKFDLIWSATDSEFRCPVKVVSNCPWTVEIPEWAEVNVPEKTDGVVELVFKGESNDGAEGKVIFKNGDSVLAELDVTIPACGDIEVYSANFAEGEFEFGDDGEYAWSEKPVDEITLEWLGSDFRVPVKVSAKCNWTIVLPDWLTVELPEKTAGDVALTFLADPAKYPLDNTSSKIIFKNNNAVVREIKVNIPGCKDIMSFALDMSLTELEFNHLGELKTSNGYISESATGYVYGTKYVRTVVVETTDGKVGSLNPKWLLFELAAWNTATGADVLQNRTMSFSVSKNEGETRNAVVFILPSSVTVSYRELFNEDATVKDEYLKWAINVTQISDADREYVMIDSAPDAEYPFTFEKATEEKQAELTALFGETNFVYVLTYESPYSRDNANMMMLNDFASYKVFSAENPTVDMSDDKDFWLQFTEAIMNSRSGLVDMYANQNLPVKRSVGYVVFYAVDNSVLAIVECHSPYEDEVLKLDNNSFMFISEAATAEIKVTSNVPWTASSNADWCTVAPVSGNRNGLITISVSENDTNEDRSAEITVSSENITHVVTVVQKFGQVLEVNVDELSFDCLKETQTIHITSNVSWTIESSANWCVVNPTSGDKGSESVVTVSVSRNVEDIDRTAVLTIKSAEISKEVKVIQKVDDGSRTNGDDLVHFVDLKAAKMAGAILERITEGEIYDTYVSGVTENTPMYHLMYSKEDAPLRITLPSNIKRHNVNPWMDKERIRVNGVVYNEYRGPNLIMGEVVFDENGSVEISMELPEGKDFLRGNINFLSSEDGVAILLVCTIDISGE